MPQGLKPRPCMTFDVRDKSLTYLEATKAPELPALTYLEATKAPGLPALTYLEAKTWRSGWKSV